MNRLVASSAMVCLTICSLHATGDVPPPNDQPDLKFLREKVRRVVVKHFPKATVTGKGQFIHFEVNTRKYMIHEPLLTGEWQDAEEEVGPQKSGIYADIQLNAGKYDGMAVLPQSWDKRYFTLSVMAPYSQKLDRHLSVHLKYPRDVPEGFLVEFKELIASFDTYIKLTDVREVPGETEN